MKRTPKFSKTIPSEAAKNANTCEMKCFSSAVSFSQCFMSSCKSTSSVEIGERKSFRERRRRLIFEMSKARAKKKKKSRRTEIRTNEKKK